MRLVKKNVSTNDRRSVVEINDRIDGKGQQFGLEERHIVESVGPKNLGLQLVADAAVLALERGHSSLGDEDREGPSVVPGREVQPSQI